MQVEHGITEMVSGLDLVNMQLELQVPGLKVRQPCTESACGLTCIYALCLLLVAIYVRCAYGVRMH